MSVERTVLYLSDVGSAHSMSLLLIFLAHVKGEEKLACAKPQGPVRFHPVPLWSDSATTHRNSDSEKQKQKNWRKLQRSVTSFALPTFLV